MCDDDKNQAIGQWQKTDSLKRRFVAQINLYVFSKRHCKLVRQIQDAAVPFACAYSGLQLLNYVIKAISDLIWKGNPSHTDNTDPPVIKP